MAGDSPYSWPTIGYMEDLTAASHSDVVEFFKKYYAPNNASLVVAGDIDFDRTRALVEKWFGEIPRGTAVEPVAPPAAILTGVQKKTLTDKVTLPRLYLAWLTPRFYAPGDAALDITSSVLAGGKNSRLYKRLVYDMQIAQDVSAFQQSGALGSQFQIVATARTGHTAAELQKVIDEELDRLRRDGPQPREVQRAINQMEASFYQRMERVGSFGGKADQLNAYAFAGGGPDYFAEDLARYTSLSPSDIQSASVQWLPADRRVEARRGAGGEDDDSRLSALGSRHCCSRWLAGVVAVGSHAGRHRTHPTDRSRLRSVPVPQLKLPTIQKRALSNGVPVWLVEAHEVPLVQVTLLLKSGSSDDPARQVRAGKPDRGHAGRGRGLPVGARDRRRDRFPRRRSR